MSKKDLRGTSAFSGAEFEVSTAELTMAITRIPEQYLRGFVRIKALAGEEIPSLVSALENPSSKGTKTAALAVTEVLPSLSKSEADGIVRSLSSLYAFMAGDPDASASEIISDLIAILDVAAEDALAFRAKMTQLLDLRQFPITSKIDRLKSDFHSIFHDVKTLTDLRPVFENNAKERPVGFTVAHTLKLVYHEVGEHKELYLSVGPKGLARIKRAVERAEEKGASLIALLADTKLKDLSE